MADGLPPPQWPETNSELLEAFVNDPILTALYQRWEARGDCTTEWLLEQCVVILAKEKKCLIEEATQQSFLLPRRICGPGGETLIYRVPDHLVPE